MKKSLLNIGTLSLLLGTSVASGYAQMVGSNAYLKGNYVEIGLDGLGGFEGAPVSTSPPLPGMHYRSSTGFFGFVANPQMDAWTVYNGDYFTPGSPENGWGIEIGDSSYVAFGTPGLWGGNNCNYLHEMPGTLTSFSATAGTINAVWEGDVTNGGTNLHVLIDYLLGVNDLYFTTTVHITNNTSTTIPKMYYYRNLDPDNNEEIGFDFTTQNTIVSQASSGSVGQITAESNVPYYSYFSFITLDSTANWRCGYGGFSNRDASDMWHGGVTSTGTFPQTVGSTNFADEAIYIAFDIDSLAPGNTQSFKYATVFTDSVKSIVLATLGMQFPDVLHVCKSDPAFALAGASPAGGTYSGDAVMGGMFEPAVANVGFNTVYYSYYDGDSILHTNASVVQVENCSAAGVPELTQAEFKLYPNPANGSVNIDLGATCAGAQLQINDLLGRTVYSKQLGNESHVNIDLSNLEKGIYLVGIHSATSSIQKKLVIQ